MGGELRGKLGFRPLQPSRLRGMRTWMSGGSGFFPKSLPPDWERSIKPATARAIRPAEKGQIWTERFATGYPPANRER